MKEKDIVCFIILHYNDLDATLECIESIKLMNQQERIKIVMIDNKSTNNSGKKLYDLYCEDSQIITIMNECNAGFSGGNNKGCLYAKTIWDAAFYVVANNDIIFQQKDFIDIVEKEYHASHFAVLGPDIFNSKLKIHQSPLSDRPTMKAVSRTILLNKIALFTFDFSYLLVDKWVNSLRKKGKMKKDYDQYQIGKSLMGACLIFSKEYMQKRERPFMPETNFYYEEYLLSLWCEENDEVMVYQPQLKVVHNEGRATDTVSLNQKERTKFRVQNIYDAAKIYRKELNKYNAL